MIISVFAMCTKPPRVAPPCPASCSSVTWATVPGTSGPWSGCSTWTTWRAYTT